MAEVVEEKQPGIVETTPQQIIQVVLAGLVAGVITGGLTILLSTYLFKVAPCVGAACGSGGQYAAILAAIISGTVALFLFMRVQVFRPLLVVIAVTISLWGIALTILNWPWYIVVAVSAGLHAVAYGLFMWLSRIRYFWLVVVLLAAVVAGIRYILAS